MQQRTPAWFEARKDRITASMVGAILGIAPYMTRDDAMRAMVRESVGAEREFKGNIATEYGTNNEAGALIDYRLETGHEPQAADIAAKGILVSNAKYVDKDGAPIIISCPYSLRNAEGTVQFASAFQKYHKFAELQAEMFIRGIEWSWFFQWAPNGVSLEKVGFDVYWIGEKIPRLIEFHEEFMEDCRSPSQQFYLGEKPVVIDTPEAHKMVAELDELNEQLDMAAERKKDLLAKMVLESKGRTAYFAGRKLAPTIRGGKPTEYWQVK